MNYAICVFGLIAIVSIIQWFTDGSKSFQGPRDLGGLLELARAEMFEDERKNKRSTVVVEEKAA